MGNNAVTRSAGATTHMCTDFFARLFQRERQGSKIIPQEKEDAQWGKMREMSYYAFQYLIP